MSHDCPRRIESGISITPGPDEFRARGESHPTCSYCGSMDPDALMARIEAGDVELGPTDKSYKIYVRDILDAGLGFAKFYFQHFSPEQQVRFIELFNAGKLHIGTPGYFYRLPFFCRPVEKPAP